MNIEKGTAKEMKVLWLGILLMVAVQGCVSATGPLAILPIVSPKASELNLLGIEDYNNGKWELARQHFEEALRADNQLPEGHFNLALTLHKLEEHELATQHFEQAGKLAPKSESIVESSVYRNHLGLSSTFERHISGGYRYSR